MTCRVCARAQIIEVGKAGPGAFRLPPQDLPVPPDAAADFPVAVQVSRKHDIVYIVTKMAYVYLYDVHTGSVIFRTRITDQAVFAAIRHEATNGIIAVTAQSGQVRACVRAFVRVRTLTRARALCAAVSRLSPSQSTRATWCRTS